MVSKELLEKARKCTTKEELLELAKKENVEVSEDEIKAFLNTNNKELSGEELENVTGGTCYSDRTYAELGIEPSFGGIESWYHPVITTIGNACSLHPDKNNPPCACSECDYSEWIGITLYCKVRSEEYDPSLSKVS